MVRGLEKFREHFKDYSGCYIIIGGTARDIAISDAGFKPKGTKDIDIILIVEALDSDFVESFWTFVIEGGYEIREKNREDRKYYRFGKPTKEEFPYLLELFSRKPDVLNLREEAHLTPIPVSEEVTSLSAILLTDDYYNFTLSHCKVEDGIRIANVEAIICLKVKAFLEMTERKANGEEVDSNKIKKHKLDLFRLAILLTEEDHFILPESLKSDLQTFTDQIKEDLPDNYIFKEMGLGAINVKSLFEQMIKNFNLAMND